MTARKIIMTSDPGQDQAVAILLALASPDAFEPLGIVATAGNIGLEQAERNTRKILELAGRPDIPVFLGASRPIKRKLVTAAHVHGPTGLDGPTLPEPTMKLQAKPGVAFIVETLRAAEPGTISIISLSPLTNRALALIAPSLFQGRAINVMVETQGALTLGMTVADWWRITDRPHNVFYVRDGDSVGFYDLLAERLARLP